MGEEQQPDSGKEKSSLPQFSAMQIVIIIGVIVIATIFVAKFGFGTDLLSPSSGEMAILKKPVAPVQQVVQTPEIRPAVSFRPELRCPANQSLCGSTCTNRMTDPDNCGFCGKVCPSYNFTDRKCISAQCSNICQPGYYDCNQNMADGCESDLKDKENCGRCGHSCSVGCLNGQCIYGGGMTTMAPPQQL
jgi:hypothetical protein